MKTRWQVPVFLLLLCSGLSAQDNSSYSFLAAGHAYGAHDGENMGLYPALLNSFRSGYDSSVVFCVFTGDIVRYTNPPDSWELVQEELNELSLDYYFVMGNHDDTDAGHAAFEELYGSTYYSFYHGKELFIMLNSTEQQKAISTGQLSFLQEQIDQTGDSIRNIFIFFHELIWNSHEKYMDVRSNNRSRYDEILGMSNYWEEVHPLLMEVTGKNIYLIAGDVGGRPDAIAAFYDCWDHITFLASGMGEVADENYLLVHVTQEDSVSFELLALDPDLDLPAVDFFSIPPSPSAIYGPVSVLPGSRGLEYRVDEINNADSYFWELPAGATGISSSNRIELGFTDDFRSGILSVQAEKDGFGKGPATSMSITGDATFLNTGTASPDGIHLLVRENADQLLLSLSQFEGKTFTVRLTDTAGRVLVSGIVDNQGEYVEIQVNKKDVSCGILVLSVSADTLHQSWKIAVGR